MYEIGDIATFETHPNTIKEVSVWDSGTGTFQFRGFVFQYRGQEIDEWNNPCEHVAEVIGRATESWLERFNGILDKLSGNDW